LLIKDIVRNIKCLTLVLDAEKDDSFPGQPKKVYDTLTSPKSYIRFTVANFVNNLGIIA
jgi:hypothetical protein